MLSVVDELGGDKATGILGSVLQLLFPEGEELEMVKDYNCQGLVCLAQRVNVHVPVFYLKSGCSTSQGFLSQESGMPRVESAARPLLDPHPHLPH